MADWSRLKDGRTGYRAEFPGTSVAITVFGERFAKDRPENVECLPLQEGEFYWFETSGGKLSAKSSFVSCASSSGRLNPGTSVGFGVLYAEGHEDTKSGLSLEVASVVISYDRDFQALLEDLTGRIADLQMQHSSDVALWVKHNPDKKSEHNVQRLFFLLGLIKNESFDVAIHHVVYQPVMRLIDREGRQDVRRAARLDRNVLIQFASSARRMPMCGNHPLYHKLKYSLPESVSACFREETVDVPENRFVKFAIGYFRGELQKYAQEMKSAGNENLAVSVQLREAVELLDKWLGHMFFRSVGNLESFPSASIVLQKREGYREILKKWVQYQMGASLEWEGGADIYKAHQRNMAALYEYWCCLKLFDIASGLFRFKEGELFKTLAQEKGLVFGLKQGNSFTVEGFFERKDSQDEQRFRKLNVTFSYNRTFSAPGESWSMTMRPDFTLAFWPKGMNEEGAAALDLVTYVHFDAKYKARSLRQMLEESDGGSGSDSEQQKDVKRVDILKMHSYRDAIRRTGGAYVLYPGTVDEKENQRNEYEEILPGLGAFPLSPSRDSSINISEFLRRIANHLCDRITQWENFTFERYRAFNPAKAVFMSDTLECNKDGLRHNIADSLRTEQVKVATLEAENISRLTIYGSTRGKDQSAWMKDQGWYPLPVDIASEQGVNVLDDIKKKKLLVIIAPIRAGKTPEVEVFSIANVLYATAEQLLADYKYYKQPTHKAYWMIKLKNA